MSEETYQEVLVIGKEIRLKRLFSEGKRAVIVAMDHGQTFGPLAGLIDFTAAAEKLKEADGVLLAPQMIRFTGTLFHSRNSPIPIARLNWNSRLCEQWGYEESHTTRTLSARAAVSLGAEALMVGLILKTGSEKRDVQNVGFFSQLVEESYELGIPLIGEVFPAHQVTMGQVYEDKSLHEYIKIGCRIACELGADAIKTFYTGESFAEVVEGTPIPIFALGAEKMERELQALELAYRAVKAGARGVVFGRNVIQAKAPDRFLAALKAVVKEGFSPAEAAGQYDLH
ncbi:MAG: class I fructose-bisphosphate aldolase [Anaerolineae bacterium]